MIQLIDVLTKILVSAIEIIKSICWALLSTGILFTIWFILFLILEELKTRMNK